MVNTDERAYSLIGIAMKAGRVSSGETAGLSAIASGEARLVVIAENAGANSFKRFTDKCAYTDTPCIVFGDKARLGISLGKAERSAIAVTDKGLAEKIKELIIRRG